MLLSFNLLNTRAFHLLKDHHHRFRVPYEEGIHYHSAFILSLQNACWSPQAKKPALSIFQLSLEVLEGQIGAVILQVFDSQ